MQRLLEQLQNNQTTFNLSAPSIGSAQTSVISAQDRHACVGTCEGLYPAHRVYLCNHPDCERKADSENKQEEDDKKEYFCINCGLEDHRWKSHAFNPENEYLHSLHELIEPEENQYEVISNYIINWELFVTIIDTLYQYI